MTTTAKTCPRCDRTGGARDDGYHVPCFLMDENDRLRAALERIVLINGSTGGHKAMVAEFKHIAQEALSSPASGAM